MTSNIIEIAEKTVRQMRGLPEGAKIEPDSLTDEELAAGHQAWRDYQAEQIALAEAQPMEQIRGAEPNES